MIKTIKNKLKKWLKAEVLTPAAISVEKYEEQKILTANILRKINSNISVKDLTSLHLLEFKVFSQWGDDGIIQYLVDKLEIEAKIFVEFGVEDYKESNTRFLLINNNWTGLVLDGDETNIANIHSSNYFWKYDLKASTKFITAENVNQTLKAEGFMGELGLLHIDIDGNDYWVWKALTIVDPIIVIMEYNSVFGSQRAITIPYNPHFSRIETHYSGLYAGSSLRALCVLAEEKGYYFIGSNSAGNNAYFIKKEKIGGFKPLSIEEGYVESKFRESRDKNHRLTFIAGEKRLDLIKGLPVYNVEKGRVEKI